MQSYTMGDRFLWDPGVFPIGPQAWGFGPSSARRLGICPQAAAAHCVLLPFNQGWGDGSGVSRCCKSWLADSMRHALLLLSVKCVGAGLA